MINAPKDEKSAQDEGGDRGREIFLFHEQSVFQVLLPSPRFSRERSPDREAGGYVKGFHEGFVLTIIRSERTREGGRKGATTIPALKEEEEEEGE